MSQYGAGLTAHNPSRTRPCRCARRGPLSPPRVRRVFGPLRRVTRALQMPAPASGERGRKALETLNVLKGAEARLAMGRQSMLGADEASAMSEGAVLAEGSEPDAETVFADRIDLLYRLGRHHLFLPFSALCIVGILYTGQEP